MCKGSTAHAGHITCSDRLLSPQHAMALLGWLGLMSRCCTCRRRAGAEGLEDGTTDYLSIAATRHGFAQIRAAGGFPAIQAHTAAITRCHQHWELCTDGLHMDVITSLGCSLNGR